MGARLLVAPLPASKLFSRLGLLAGGGGDMAYLVTLGHYAFQPPNINIIQRESNHRVRTDRAAEGGEFD